MVFLFYPLNILRTVKSLKRSERKTTCQNHNKFCFVLFSAHRFHRMLSKNARNRVIVSNRYEVGRKQNHRYICRIVATVCLYFTQKYHYGTEFTLFPMRINAHFSMAYLQHYDNSKLRFNSPMYYFGITNTFFPV